MKYIKIIAISAAMAGAVSCAQQKNVDIDGTWKIVEVNGTEVPADVEFINTPSATLENGRYSINAGANVINGEFKIENNVVTFGEGAMTKMMASEAVMEIEDAIVTTLAQPLSVAFQGDTLVFDSENSTVLRLIR